jgi:hypothetical protein
MPLWMIRWTVDVQVNRKVIPLIPGKSAAERRRFLKLRPDVIATLREDGRRLVKCFGGMPEIGISDTNHLKIRLRTTYRWLDGILKK